MKNISQHFLSFFFEAGDCKLVNKKLIVFYRIYSMITYKNVGKDMLLTYNPTYN